MNWIKKHKTVCTVLGIIFLFLMSCFAFVWAKLGLIHYEKPQEPVPEPPVEETVPKEDLEQLEWPELPAGELYHDPDVFNFMILGTDERGGEISTNARSDSMILVSMDRRDKTVKLVSLERGMGVPVLNGPYKGQYDWLTHMFRYGGADLVMETIRECLLVDVHHYVRVNFETVETLIDAIGGVDIDLTEEEALYFSNAYVNGRKPPQRKAGPNHLDGFYALAYARLREIDSDWSRVQRQRRVIIAAVDKLKDSSLLELNSLVDRMLPLVRTNFTRREIAQMVLIVPGFLPPQIRQMTVPAENTYSGGMIGMGGRSLYRVDFDTNARLLREFLYGPDAVRPEKPVPAVPEQT